MDKMRGAMSDPLGGSGAGKTTQACSRTYATFCLNLRFSAPQQQDLLSLVDVRLAVLADPHAYAGGMCIGLHCHIRHADM